MARLTRQERSDENRAKILASAREHFERYGYHGASVDAIAEAAGFSKGIIYSQFGNKDELMLAVLAASIEQRREATEQLAAALGGVAAVDDLLRQAFEASLQTPAWQAALVEFRVHAWRDPALNSRYRSLHERTVDKVAAALGDALRTDTDNTRRVATALLAANTGLVVESFVGGDVDLVGLVRTVGAVLRPDAGTTTTGGTT